MDESNQPVSTLNNTLPIPSSVLLAADYLVKVIDEDMGTQNGPTALYWNLIHVIQQHVKKEKK